MSICRATSLDDLEDCGEVEEDQQRPWSDILVELVDLFALQLSLADRIRLPAVCKNWSRVSTPLHASKSWPYLMFLGNPMQASFGFFDPLNGKVYSLNDIVTTSGLLALRFSKDGWLVLSDGDDSVFMFNPFTDDEELVELPTLPFYYYALNGISFSSPPTCPDCVVFGIHGRMSVSSSVWISLWRYGEDKWSDRDYANNLPFLVAENNPVYHNGLFYCLGRNGNLGVFNPTDETWTVLDKPKPSHPMIDSIDIQAEVLRNKSGRSMEELYLVESKGELLSVFDGNQGRPVLVFKLDRTKMAWKKVEDLGDEIIFVDTRSSIAVPAPVKGTGNKIYFSRFSDGDRKECECYCLRTKKRSPSVDDDLEQYTNCVWVHPNLYQN